MKKYTYTKVLANKGIYTHSARLLHLLSKGNNEVPTLARRVDMHEVYKQDSKVASA